jgi:hypothetical protein
MRFPAPVEVLVMRYTQGVCDDGVAILMDGFPMTMDEIVSSLNVKTQTIARLTRKIEEISPESFDDNTETGS